MIALLATSLWGQSGQNAAATHDLQQQASLMARASEASVPREASVANSNFVIGNEDVLAISVWKEPELSRVIPVRTDGKISIPLIGELQASGKTPKQLQAEITGGLQSFISEPEVTVIVQEIKSLRFNILGHVQKPGSYLLSPPMTLVDAIAIAGGFRDFAKTKSIYVLRDDGGKQVRLPFNYKQVIKGSHSDQNIQLQPRDTIVVP
jgi:polysaccharide export outer membrane protein